MDERSLRVLEFDKILAQLAEHTASSLGQALVWALRPATHPKVVQQRLHNTTEARKLLERYGPMPLGGLTDIRTALKRARAQFSLSGSELLAVADVIYCAERLRAYMAQGENVAPTLAALASSLSDQSPVRERIEETLDEEGNVRPDASNELKRLYQRQALLESRIRERMESLMRQAAAQDVLQEPLIVQRQGRFCLPVRSERQGQIRGLVHDRSDSGATVFIEPLEIVELGNQLREIELAIQEEIKRLLQELSQLVGNVAAPLEQDLETLAELDFVHACAHLAQQMNATEPQIRKDGVVVLRGARHPLLSGHVVPIDFWIGEEFDTLLITGPNTGGKTVCLKTVGLLTLMAQAGLHIPADPGSAINVFSSIWADIGDEQSIEQSLSTFSSHMTQIIKILQRVEAWRQRQAKSQPARHKKLPFMNCLVLLDELGAGTDPTEGAALGQIILQELHSVGCRTVATTHYNDLKIFVYATAGMENASVEFDAKTLQPTYKLRIGEPGSSNALQIAQRLGMPRRLVQQARQLLGEGRLPVEEALQEMRRSRSDLERERRRLGETLKELEKLRAEYEKSLQELSALRQQTLEEGYERALAIVRGAEEQARRIIAELQRQPKQSRITEEKRREIAQLRQQLEQQALESSQEAQQSVLAEATAPPSAQATQIVQKASHLLEKDGNEKTPPGLAPEAEMKEEGPALPLGAYVRLKKLNQTGHITARLQPNYYRVAVAHMTFDVAREDIELLQEPISAEARRLAQTMQLRKASTFKSEIHLRGATVEEALAILDKYLDDAQLAGATNVRIVHGKGTGALRQGIHKYLRTHPAVQSFHQAPWEEGGEGVTLVELK